MTRFVLSGSRRKVGSGRAHPAGTAREGSNDRFGESRAVPLGRQTNRLKDNKQLEAMYREIGSVFSSLPGSRLN